MAAVVYFSSASNNTARFVEHCAFEGAGIHTARIRCAPPTRPCTLMSHLF